jgi:ribosomal protein S18 acetylase RimI-like enzyme
MKIEHPLQEDIAALRALWKEAFADPDSYLDLFFSTAFQPERCMYVRENGNIPAAAYWMDCEIAGRKAAYVYAVATAETYRGRGFCRALMENIHIILRDRDYCGSILVPGDAGLRQMYGAMGYEDFGSKPEYAHTSEHCTQMQKIGREEFAGLRRSFLPENGVIQEGAQLMLLDALADFYRGDGFLLTVSKEGNRILELLGDETAAGFYMTGRQQFAMYHPLTEEIYPAYFAFAFD